MWNIPIGQMSNELEKTWKRKEEESPRSNHLLLTQIMDKLADEVLFLSSIY